MRTRLLLGLAAAAVALTMPGTGHAETYCVPHSGGPLGYCVIVECGDHHCITRDVTVKGHCQHPTPPRVCALLNGSTGS